MKVLVTGNLGYVGNILTKMLIQKNHEVIGCDIGYFAQDFLEQIIPKNQLQKDIRDLTIDDLRGVNAILHLAALSNDPLGEINSSLTNEINFLATIRLAKLAKEVGVERFVFSSSCSTYGANSETVDELSPLAPITSYAKSKVNSENELLKLESDFFAPTILRSATAYGISPNLRLDLVVNNLTGSAFTTGKVHLLSDGTAWRPLVHVEDMAAAFISVLETPLDRIKGEKFNVGSNLDNYKVKQIAELVEEIVPDSKIEFSKNADRDTRSYMVNFDKITKQVEFKTKWSLKKGIKQIYDFLKSKNFDEDDFTNKKFYRVRHIKWLLEQKKIDNDLRVIKF